MVRGTCHLLEEYLRPAWEVARPIHGTGPPRTREGGKGSCQGRKAGVGKRLAQDHGEVLSKRREEATLSGGYSGRQGRREAELRNSRRAGRPHQSLKEKRGNATLCTKHLLALAKYVGRELTWRYARAVGE